MLIDCSLLTNYHVFQFALIENLWQYFSLNLMCLSFPAYLGIYDAEAGIT